MLTPILPEVVERYDVVDMQARRERLNRARPVNGNR
jgi:hypothetical protein